jgi:hypothetical protein
MQLAETKFHDGRKPYIYKSTDWRWAEYRADLKAAGVLPKIPLYFGHANTYEHGAWRMLANGPDPTAPGKAAEGCGDCVWAAADHETMEMLTDSDPNWPNDKNQIAELFNGATAVSDYAACTGYNPETGEGDNGTEIRQALEYRQKTGIIDAKGNRHKIGVYVALEPGNLQHLLEAIYFFEGIPIGIVLQEAQMNQFTMAEEKGKVPVWSYVPGSPDIGGHCVPLMGRPNLHAFAGVSWALRIFLESVFMEKCCEEAWAYLTPERISKVTGKTFEGASEGQLQEYAHIVGKAGVEKFGAA